MGVELQRGTGVNILLENKTLFAVRFNPLSRRWDPAG